MRKILKRLGVVVLSLSLAITPVDMNVSLVSAADNGQGGAGGSDSNYGGSSNHNWKGAKMTCYGFRVYLHTASGNVDDYSKRLWYPTNRKKTKFRAKATYTVGEEKKDVRNILDSDAIKSACYLGLDKSQSYKVLNSNSGKMGKYVKVPKKRILTDGVFSNMPGIGTFNSAKLKDTGGTHWSDYAKIFNGLTKQMGTVKKAKKVLKWFKKTTKNSKGEVTKANLLKNGKTVYTYSAENIVVVVEPVAVWKLGKTNYLVTFQNAVKSPTPAQINPKNPKNPTIFKFYKSVPITMISKKIGGYKYWKPGYHTQRAAKKIAGLGGFYQKFVKKSKPRDCQTKAYDTSSGYACYGTKRLETEKGKIATNIAITYGGGINTTDQSKLKIYKTLNYRDGDEQVYKVSNDKGDWKAAKTDAKKLGISKNSDLNDYVAVLSSVEQFFEYSGNDNRKTTSYKSVVNYMNWLNKKHIKFKWVKTNASGATHNIGSTYRIKKIRHTKNPDSQFRQNTSSIVEALDLKKIKRLLGGSGYVDNIDKDGYKNVAPKTSVKYVKSEMNQAYKYSDGAYSEDSGVKNSNIFGMSMQVLVKEQKVKSYIVTTEIRLDENGKVTKSETKVANPLSYRTTDFNSKTGYTVGSGVCYAIAVPNYDSKAGSRINTTELTNVCIATDGSDTLSSATVISNFEKYFDGSEKVIDGSAQKGDTIKIGTALKDGDSSNKPYGYSVYLLKIKDTPGTGEEETKGNLELKDYEINTVFPDMCAEATNNGEPMVVTLNKNLWTYEGIDYCNGSSYNSSDQPQSYQQNYTLVVTETSASGKTVKKDDSLSGTKMLLAYTPLNFGTRSELKSGKEFDSRLDHKVSYAFNLSRGLFGDKRTVSTISDQTLGQDFATTVLDLEYGDTPQTIKKATANRNSNATVGDAITDTFNFDAKYKVTDSKTKHKEIVNKSHWHYYKYWYTESGTNSDGSTWSRTAWTWRQDFQHNYIDFIDHENELVAFNINELKAQKVELEITSIAHKYQTEANETGKNTKVPDSKYLREELQKPKTGSNGMTENLTIGSEKTGYATAYVKNSETVLSFYPEVPMQAMEYSGDTITSSDSVAIKRVLTIGEELRKAKSSSLYLFTVKRDKSTGTDDNDLSGTTYSDTAVGGSKASKISDMVTLTAGGDFGVAVKETGFSLNLYGYAMDVINSDEDDSMLVAQSGVKDMASGVENTQDVSINYTDIVKDGSNVYSDWENESDSSTMEDEFKTWVTAMLKPENFKADMEMQLYKGNTDERLRGSSVTNFNTTLGKLSDGDDGDEMTFPLTVRHGEVVKCTIDANGNQTTTLDSNYEKFISQLADDYGLGDGDGTTRFEKAEKLFKASGLYTSIIDAIESDKSTANNSLSQKEQSEKTAEIDINFQVKSGLHSVPVGA